MNNKIFSFTVLGLGILAYIIIIISPQYTIKSLIKKHFEGVIYLDFNNTKKYLKSQNVICSNVSIKLSNGKEIFLPYNCYMKFYFATESGYRCTSTYKNALERHVWLCIDFCEILKEYGIRDCVGVIRNLTGGYDLLTVRLLVGDRFYYYFKGKVASCIQKDIYDWSEFREEILPTGEGVFGEFIGKLCIITKEGSQYCTADDALVVWQDYDSVSILPYKEAQYKKDLGSTHCIRSSGATYYFKGYEFFVNKTLTTGQRNWVFKLYSKYVKNAFLNLINAHNISDSNISSVILCIGISILDRKNFGYKDVILDMPCYYGEDDGYIRSSIYIPVIPENESILGGIIKIAFSYYTPQVSQNQTNQTQNQTQPQPQPQPTPGPSGGGGGGVIIPAENKPPIITILDYNTSKSLNNILLQLKYIVRDEDKVVTCYYYTNISNTPIKTLNVPTGKETSDNVTLDLKTQVFYIECVDSKGAVGKSEEILITIEKKGILPGMQSLVLIFQRYWWVILVVILLMVYAIYNSIKKKRK